MTAPGAQWTPAPARPRWRVALLAIGVVVAVVTGFAFVWWQSEGRETAPDPIPAPSLPGLSGGTTFSMGSDTEAWVSGVLIEAHSGNDRPGRSTASYSVSGPGFETIKVSDPPGTVIEIPGWGQLTVERVRSESVERDLEPGETGAVEPTATLYFRAVTDFPLVAGSEEFPTDE